jgi:prophage regulatory protein
MTTDNKIISLNELAQLLNKSKVTIWRYWAKEKILPAPIQINGRCLGWKQSVITDWLDSQIQGR